MENKLSWKIGSAAKGTAGVLAIALAAFAIHCMFEEEPSPSLASLEQTQEAVNSVDLNGLRRRVTSMAPSAIGEAMLARLAPYKHLPKSYISVVVDSEANRDIRNVLSSFATQELVGESCSVVMVVDDHGLATIARDMRGMLGLTPSARLAERLGNFELLHELGHCESAHGKASFQHPELSAEQNNAVSEALKNSAEGDLWQESFADAYSALSLLDEARGDARKMQQAKADIDLVLQWRKMGRARIGVASEEAEMNKLVLGRGSHLTEMAMEEALSSSRWLDATIPVANRAAQLASVGLMRSMSTIDTPSAVERNLAQSKEKLSPKIMAAQAWSRGVEQEARLARKLEDPRPAALARVSAIERAGEGMVANGFYPSELDLVEEASKLKKWRESRALPSPQPTPDFF